MSSPLNHKLSLWNYLLISIALLLFLLAALSWYSTERHRDFFTAQLQDFLEDRASIVAARITENGSAMHIDTDSCQVSGSVVDFRLTVVTASGEVLCDSWADVSTMDNHANRLEIATALTGSVASSTRFSQTLSSALLYVALPVPGHTPPHYVVRAAIPLKNIDEHLAEFKLTTLALGFLLAATAGLVSLYFYRRINLPLKDIIDGAQRFAQGRFSSKLPDYGVREIAELGSALNRMAEQLEHLETIRKDFVANVSHELKTPITSIKGFVETLNDGAKENPEDLERFLGILQKQSNRLEAIVGDLLTLSRLESEPASQLLNLRAESVRGLLQMASELCALHAKARRISIHSSCDSSLETFADGSLLVQALTNLLDNAIKYSDEGTEVHIVATQRKSYVRIDIIDQGPGISAEHIPRLFERFYRIDKARSRALGGTGLGLSIVKHIATLHSGNVWVESTTGKRGSIFHLELPVVEKNLSA